MIATNWSGPTAFLDSSVGYPLRYDGLEDIAEPGAFLGHRWASPSVTHLMQFMRHLEKHPEEASQLGRCAPSALCGACAPTCSGARGHIGRVTNSIAAACRAARQRMQERYAPDVVASKLLSHLRGLEERLLLEREEAKQEL